MKNIKFDSIFNLPIAIIDDFYTDEEVFDIWEEINSLLNQNHLSRDTIYTGAFQKDLKQNEGLFLDSFFGKNRNQSNILVHNQKIFNDFFLNNLSKHHYFFNYFRTVSYHKTLLSYYEDGGYYKPHCDQSTISTVTWFFKKPKSFTGGNLIIDNVELECKFNRTVIFPSILFHSVTPVCIDKNQPKGSGRFSITQFFSNIS
jgi:Rps23 Pro-64 3,4-dihydroxylase Tpa1-like proline 4-hydroxylase